MTRHERDEYKRRAVLNACVLAAVYPWKARQAALGERTDDLVWDAGPYSPFQLIVAGGAYACIALYEHPDQELQLYVDQYLRHVWFMSGEFHRRCDDLGYELLTAGTPVLELCGDYRQDWGYRVREERVCHALSEMREDPVLKHIVSSFERVYVPMLQEPARARDVLERISEVLLSSEKRIATE